MRFSLRRLFLWVTGIAVFLGLMVGAYHVLTDVEFGEHQPSVTWLPKSATNVSYYKSYVFTAYEFEIPEDDFLRWSPYKLSPISGSVHVWRYRQIRSKIPDYGPNPTPLQIQEQEDAFALKRVIVTNGWAYIHRQHNGGGVIVAYDRESGKAYFWHSPR